jgi:hypothetical protein
LPDDSTDAEVNARLKRQLSVDMISLCKQVTMPDKQADNQEAGARAAQSPFDSRWFAYVNDKTHGPYSGHRIRKMVADGEIVGTDLVVVEGNSSWVQAKDDPVLRLLFVRADSIAERPPTRHTAKRGRRINLIATVIMLGGLIWMAWPYYAAYDLAMGLRNGDEATLQSRINWESVRQSLRGDLNASFLKHVSEDKSDLGRGFALMLGPALVNQIVDGYITPQAVSRIVKGSQAKDVTDVAFLPSSQDVQTGLRNFSARQIGYAFFAGGPLSFRIDIRPADDSKPGVTTLFFRWSGDWNLTRVTLPLDEIQQWNAQAKQPPAHSSIVPSPPVALPNRSSLEAVLGKANPLSWGAMFQKQVERCWKKPTGGSEIQKAEAAFTMRLKRDGTLDGSPVPEKTPVTPYLRSYQDSALRAIVDCQPYNLPAAYFDEWKYFAPVFTERAAVK